MTDKQLYMTIGVGRPGEGGEFACWADNDEAARQILQQNPQGRTWKDARLACREAHQPTPFIRLAPQDVVDWVTDRDLPGKPAKMPGGWSMLYGTTDSMSAHFIPVPLTANLTVINTYKIEQHGHGCTIETVINPDEAPDG